MLKPIATFYCLDLDERESLAAGTDEGKITFV